MNDDKLQMKKYYDREDDFTYDEKIYIGRKCNDQCAHCGKKIFPEFGLTIDHFIPLDKGGSNRSINLIPLCRTCNEEKDNKLYKMDYIKYMKPKYYKELSGYLASYVQVTDFIQRNRILAYDEYTYTIDLPEMAQFTHKKSLLGLKSKFTIKLATYKELPKLCDYYKKYLKKYNLFDDDNSVRENLLFWINFGCIYFVEKNNEITVMIAITIKRMSEEYNKISSIPVLHIFPYYSTDVTTNIVKSIIFRIPKTICNENNIPHIPITLTFLKDDKIKLYLTLLFNLEDLAIASSVFESFNIIIDRDETNRDETYVYNKKDEDLNENDIKVSNFLSKFNDVTGLINLLHEYFIKNPYKKDYSWMIGGVLAEDIIKDSKLSEFIDLEDDNDFTDDDDDDDESDIISEVDYTEEYYLDEEDSSSENTDS